MKVPVRFNFGLDVVMFLALGLVCAGGYFLWIGPGLRTARAKASAVEACLVQEKQYRAARADHWRIRRSLQELLQQVEHEGGGMPTQATVDQRIAEVAAIAQACGVVIEEVDPEDPAPTEEHVETQIRFRAQASYTDFRHFMWQVERQMSFLDVTHFSVAAASAATNASCRITWSVRMYSQADEPVASKAEVRRPPP